MRPLLCLTAIAFALYIAAPASAGAGPVPVCRADQLKVTLGFGPGSGSAGHQTGALLFADRSSTACTLLGYPGVSLVDGAHRQIGIPASRDPVRPVRSVTLAPGGVRAGAQVTFADVGAFDPSACRPTQAWGLRIYPPGDRTALLVRYPLSACRGAERAVSVGPVVPRSQLVGGSY